MRRPRASAFAMRAALATLTWLILTEGDGGWDAWVIGVPAIAAAGWLSAALLPVGGWSWRGALRFAGFFLWESWRGGIDVARRAFHPRMPLAPAMLELPVAVKPDLARVAVANTSSLLPGTLVVDLDDRGLVVHALDPRMSPGLTVTATDRHVAAMLALGTATDGEAAREGPR